MPAETAAGWLQRLLDAFRRRSGRLAGRDAVGPPDRRPLSRHPRETPRRRLRWLTAEHAPAHFLELVRNGGRLDREEQGLIFGESLPKGLRLGS